MSAVAGKGCVFWITGLPGAGKTTLAREICLRLERELSKPVYLDGDLLRDVLGAGEGHYSIDRRKELALIYGRLCRMLSEQGFVVVCATVSMFRHVQQWNRTNIDNYVEVLVRAPVEVLRQRDQKGLYSGAKIGAVEHVVGLDIGAEEPAAPEWIVDNDGSQPPKQMLERMWDAPTIRAALALHRGALR